MSITSIAETVGKDLMSWSSLAKVALGGVIHKIGAAWAKARAEAKAVVADVTNDVKKVV